MKARERVWAALRGEDLDRPPVSFWGHLYDRESSAADLVEATRSFQREYGWDWVKLNPRKSCFVEDWGVRYEYAGSAVVKPRLARWPIHVPTDWDRIQALPVDRGAYGEQLDAVRLLKRALPADVPFVQTVFTPLGVAGELTETRSVVRDHLAAEPARVQRALESIAVTLERYVAAVLEAGADGIYLATTHYASRDMMSPEEYLRVAHPLDLRVLRVARAAPFNVLHVCEPNNLLRELAGTPAHAFSWAATDPTNPTLGQGLSLVRGAVMGGISQDGALQSPDPGAAVEEFHRGLELTGGRRWLVGPGCSIPPGTPPANLLAVREAVENTRVH
jgi:uroporphyrinogen decarboxylase